MKKILLGIAVLIFGSLFAFWVWFPSSKQIKGCIKTTMFEVDLCPGTKNYVPLEHISKYLQNSIILTEDSSFYQHNGFDQEGIERCYEKFLEKNKIVCGGSTITQQLAKNMFLSKNKTFVRKGVEALITMEIEKTLTKKEILERYLNIVQFGKDIFGVKAAAQAYFKKSPASLSVLESAFLAMVLPNPEKYSQSYYRKDLTRFARRRLAQIIENSHKYKRISTDEYLVAMDGLDLFLKSAKPVVVQKADATAENSKDSSATDPELTIDDLEKLETENRD
ncbi:MAG: monofunctional biosynthetic peptidoglycan transglycosylase [Bdellovibrio sp.]|nr:monofunctional biosynthetic peptidoglycan transglycosylase [Bdellovibrio sp.]